VRAAAKKAAAEAAPLPDTRHKKPPVGAERTKAERHDDENTEELD